ncbi:MAG TPA: AI-2E family transporter [Candidatus Limnocylindrales bacterium]
MTVTPGRRRVSARGWLVVAAAALLVLVLILAFDAVRPFAVGVVLVYLLGPLVDRLEDRGVPRALAALLALLLAITIVVGVGAFALSPLVAQVEAFVADLPTIARDARGALEAFYRGLDLPLDVRSQVDTLVAGGAAGLSGIDVAGLARPVVGSLFSIVGAVTAYAILPAWLFFVLRDRRRLAAALERSLPVAWREDVFAVIAMANRVFGNWIRGQLALGVVVGLASFVGLELLAAVVDPVFGRYAILLALVAGLLELVPFIGPILSAIPAVLIGLTVGPGGFLAALLLYLAIQQVENNVFVPKIQGDAVELHPSAVMVALVAGAAIAGILGAILSLPITATARDVFRYLFRRLSEPPATVVEALAAVSPSLVPAEPALPTVDDGPGS